MIKIGLDPHHGAGILGFNSPEWFISYMATIMAGGISVGIYTTNNKETCQYIANDCKAQLFFCENSKQLQKITQDKDRLNNLKAIVQYIPESVQPISPEHKTSGVISWEDFLEIGKDVSDEELALRVANQQPGQCASIVYTSGTTGPPKGVMLSHDNLTWTGKVVNEMYKLTEHFRIISYLPLSHVAAQMIDLISPAINGHCVFFAQADALKGSLKDTLLEVRPTLFFGVPRVWEKFKEAIEKETKNISGVKGFILNLSKNIGRKTTENRQIGGSPAAGYWLANKLIFQGLRQKIGLDECVMTGVGAAPVPKAVTEFFSEFDIPLYQLYGMTETTAAGCLNALGTILLPYIGFFIVGIHS
jgi:long-chain-fatty-acid--CoA ligase ACSBG